MSKHILDIIVPQYTDGEETLHLLLDSIYLQQSIDFDKLGVIIVNDGTNVRLSDRFLSRYPFEITYILNEHHGISYTRQTGLDASKADYVMFCDSDDCFYTVIGLFQIFTCIENDPFDVLVSEFIEEVKVTDGGTAYITREKDGIFIHGKIYRREFLVENNIRWREDIMFHEDVYFNALATRVAKDVNYIDVPFYLWRCNSASTSRQTDFMSSTYDVAIHGNEVLIKEFISRGMPDCARLFFSNFLVDAYNTMTNPLFLESITQSWRLDILINMLCHHFHTYGYLWDETPEEDKKRLAERLESKNIDDVTKWMKFIISINVKE